MRRLLPLLLLVLAPALVRAQAPALVRRPETLRGRVTGDSARALAGAEVTATMAPDREVFRDTADADGRWEIRVASGTGDYLVHVAAPGYKALRRRVTRAAGAAAGDSVLVVDVALEPSGPQRLAAVRVEAKKRERPPRGDGDGELRGVGASERNLVEGVRGQVAPGDAGDIAAQLGTLPGVVGGTVLGVPAGANQTTLNGMAFPGGELPRDARTSTRFVSSTWDPSRGGFAGGQADVQLAPGNVFGSRRAHLTLDAPQLQATDAVGQRLGQPFLRIDASAGGDGELSNETWFYNTGAQLRRRTSDAFTLLGGDADALVAAGVPADSVARLVGLLGANAIPATRGGIPDQLTTTSGVLLGRIDHRPWRRDYGPTWGVTGYARAARTEALGLAPTATPATGGTMDQQQGAVQGVWAGYWGAAGVTEVRSALSLSRERQQPYLRLPGGQVLVSSGTAAGVPLAFGGNGLLERDDRGWTWETTTETQYVPRTRVGHRVKLFAQSRLDGFVQERPGNPYGTVTYNSLAELEAGRAASFARTLDAPQRTGGLWSGALALGDFWRVGPTLQLIGGVRLESNVFTSVPAANPEVARLFGARTDRAPNAVHASPRLGFTWAPQKNTENYGMWFSPAWTKLMMPRGVLRGGVGEFRGLYPATLLADARVRTGLAGGARQLLCVGEAVPALDWAGWATGAASVPTTCADGAGALADTAPPVALFARDYAAPRAWRANLGWNSSIKRLDYDVEVLGSYNVDQPGVEELNFDPTPRFVLPEEGGRPVYSQPFAIDPATGTVSPSSSRYTSQFGSVLASHARNVSRGGQVVLALTPNLDQTPLSRLFVRGTWVLASTRARTSGWDGAATGDPRRREWARGDFDARHQLVLQSGYFFKGMAVSAFARVQSGLPFTPRVAGDANGDGRAGNDRAFVFDPATDAAMRDLVARAPAYARECLVRQAGRIAGRNSCEGPWTATMNAQVSIPGRWVGIGARNRVSFFLANPLGGLDRLVHGERGLKGWGGPAMPDPVLLRTTGFDATAQRWRYEVNPRFGATDPSRSTLRTPFRLTIDVELVLGPTLGQQQLDRWLRPGRAGRAGRRLDSDSLLARYRRNIPDLYARILAESDSLLLQPSQVEQLRAAQAAYQKRMDAHWRTLTDHLASLGDRYDAKAALARQEQVTDEGWALAWQESKGLDRMLTPVQLRMMPWPADMLWRGKEAPKGMRIFTY